ncbi:hypothetical protein ACM66B_004478 [Microbotryomycetes sp. NB124-2]
MTDALAGHELNDETLCSSLHSTTRAAEERETSERPNGLREQAQAISWRFTEQFDECWPTIDDLEDAGVLDGARAQAVIAEHIAAREPFPQELALRQQQQQQEAFNHAKLGRRWSKRRSRPPTLELDAANAKGSDSTSTAASPRLSPLVASVVRTASKLRPRAKRTQSTNDAITLSTSTTDHSNLLSPSTAVAAEFGVRSRATPWGIVRSNSASSALQRPTGSGAQRTDVFVTDENSRPSFDSQDRVQRQPRKLVRKSVAATASSQAASAELTLSSESDTAIVSKPLLPTAETKDKVRHTATQPTSTGQNDAQTRSFDVVSRDARRSASARPVPARTQSDTSEIERQKRNVLGAAHQFGASQSSLDLDRIDEQNEDSPINSRSMSARTSQRNLESTSDGRTRTPSSNTTVGRSTVVAGASTPSSTGRHQQAVSPRSSQSLRAQPQRQVVETSASEADDEVNSDASKHQAQGRVRDGSPASTPELVHGRHYRRRSSGQAEALVHRAARSATVSSSQDDEETSSSSLTWNSADEGSTDLDHGHHLRKGSSAQLRMIGHELVTDRH